MATEEEVAAAKVAAEAKGAGAWTPPTREEWDALNKTATNKAEEAARLHAKQAKADEAAKAKADDEAKARGEFESLHKQASEKLTAVEARLAKREAMDQEELDALTKDWSADDKALIVGATAEDRLAHARKLAKRLAAEDPKARGGIKPAGGRGTAEHGGYENDIEWARHDYPAYAKHRDSLKRS